jgi:DAACS family dicarboxylate/amino acid:cation (Na+ or H+) symporter
MKLAPATRILIGFVAGALAGAGVHAAVGEEQPAVAFFLNNIAVPGGKLFLRALMMCVVPLIASSLVLGVVGLGDLRAVGRIGARTLALTLVLSGISVVIGLVTARVVRPGERLDPQTRTDLLARFGDSASEAAKRAGQTDKSFGEAVLGVLPENPLGAAASVPPDVLGLMMFALFFGVCVALVDEEKRRALVAVLEGIFEATTTMVHLIMAAAPLGVFFLLFGMTARFGLELLVSLGLFCACVIGALLFHMVVVYGAALKLVGRVSPLLFFRRSRAALVTAFSTSSSNATLPTALTVTQDELGVSKKVSSFVLTIGATANQNGTALFEGLTILFLAQVFGVELSLMQQATVLVLAIVAGIGTAGVPAGSIPFIIVLMGQLGIPVEGIAIVLGVDRLLDMCRTVVNVSGDMAAAVIIARKEGEETFLTAAGAVQRDG